MFLADFNMPVNEVPEAAFAGVDAGISSSVPRTYQSLATQLVRRFQCLCGHWLPLLNVSLNIACVLPVYSSLPQRALSHRMADAEPS
jgi:hypothetical protein